MEAKHSRDYEITTTKDMSANFLKLPSELRNKIYGLCLLLQDPIDPWINYSRQRNLVPELLRTNRTVHREASSLLYAQNRFNFTNGDAKQIASFLEKVGYSNANYIQHICIDFPNFYYSELGNFTLSDSSIRIFASIQNSCANLSMLTAFAYSTLTMENKLEELDEPEIFIELVDTCFRAISSLKKIIVGVYDDDLSCSIREKMKNCGWTIIVTEYGEEWDAR